MRKTRHPLGLEFVRANQRGGGGCVWSRVWLVAGEAVHEGRGAVEAGQDGMWHSAWMKAVNWKVEGEDG